MKHQRNTMPHTPTVLNHIVQNATMASVIVWASLVITQTKYNDQTNKKQNNIGIKRTLHSVVYDQWMINTGTCYTNAVVFISFVHRWKRRRKIRINFFFSFHLLLVGYIFLYLCAHCALCILFFSIEEILCEFCWCLLILFSLIPFYSPKQWIAW